MYLISFLFARNSEVWVFGGKTGTFNENAKALFIYVSLNCPDIDAVWITRCKSVVEEVRGYGLKAYSLFSLKGLSYALRAKFYYFNISTNDVCFFTSGSAIKVNLWHGVGLKRCGFSIKDGATYRNSVVIHNNIIGRLARLIAYLTPDYVLSSTDFQSVKFAEAFDVPQDHCLNLGYPRNDILLWTEQQRLEYIRNFEPRQTQNLLEKMKLYHKVFLYMPTWRDSQVELFVNHLDLDRLNNLMEEMDSLFLIKVHPAVKNSTYALESYSRLLLLSQSMDVYSILPYTNTLITDYSSILYDYLLMEDKDTVLFIYDYKEYVDERGLNYPYFENVAGAIASDYDVLEDILRNEGYDRSKYAEIRERFWGSYNGCATEQVAGFFLDKAIQKPADYHQEIAS